MRKSTKYLFIFLILIFGIPSTLHALTGGILFGTSVDCPEAELICDENGLCRLGSVIACAAMMYYNDLPDDFIGYIGHTKSLYIFLLSVDAVIAGIFFGTRFLYDKIKQSK